MARRHATARAGTLSPWYFMYVPNQSYDSSTGGAFTGMMQKRVKVCNSKDPERCFEQQFRVDTGAIYSFVPEEHRSGTNGNTHGAAG
jgi:hypothetical protein